MNQPHLVSYFQAKSVAVFVGILVFFAGCSREQPKKPTPLVIDPAPPNKPARPIIASFETLGTKPNSDDDVQWAVALTLAEIASAAYDEPVLQDSKLKKLGANEVFSFSEGSSAGLVASDDRSVVIAFRGTQSIADMLTDIKVFGKAVEGGRMHRGFFDAVEAVYTQAIESAEGHGAKTKRLWITGHSLGGAMAAAFTFKSSKENRFRPAGIVTFGQPLVMSESLCQFLLDEFQNDYIRFVNNGDPVARVLRPYRHSGARVFFKDDDYVLRKPMVAYSAPAGVAKNVSPQVSVVEDEESLQLLTDEEVDQLEKSVKESEALKNAPRRAPDGVMAVGAWDPFAQHYMAVYINNLKTIGQAKIK